MEYAAAPGRNSFKQPKKDDILTYATSDILCQMHLFQPTKGDIIQSLLKMLTKLKRQHNDNLDLSHIL